MTDEGAASAFLSRPATCDAGEALEAADPEGG
jgi:hypothetical protein